LFTASDALIAIFFKRRNRLEKDQIVPVVVFPSAEIWQRQNFRRDIYNSHDWSNVKI
jgi:hypothetical protein